MFKIAICDNEQLICSKLENVILEHAQRKCLNIEVEVFLSGERLCDYIIHEESYDLIYLDIQMEMMTGIDVGKIIRQVMQDQKTEIVFISGKDNYDRQLFDLQPLHFISKPIDTQIVIEDLELALLRSDKVRGTFTYHKGTEIFRIPIQDIIFFECNNRTIEITTVNGKDSFYATISAVYQAVKGYHFLKIHRAYLINCIHIKSFNYDEVLMINKEQLPISQSRRKEIRDYLLSIG